MNANEIKKAWNTFKKEAKKELSFSTNGCCYMNAKQIANGTATIFLCCDIEYDKEIAYHRASIAKVNGYDTWTDEEKKRSEEHNLEMIAYYERLKATYGDRPTEAEKKAGEIFFSAAFRKLADAIGIKDTELELVKKWEGLNQYQIRIHY